MANITADRRIYLNEDEDTLLEEGDPEARTLFAAEGDEISEDAAKRLGYKPLSESKMKEAAANKAKQHARETKRGLPANGGNTPADAPHAQGIGPGRPAVESRELGSINAPAPAATVKPTGTI